MYLFFQNTQSLERTLCQSICYISYNLKLHDYFEYLLTEILKHLDDTDRSFLDDLLPWSPNLPANCRKPGKDEVK